MAVNKRTSKSAKEIALEGKSAEYRAKIAEIQLRLRIEDDSDPFFWALASSSNLAHVFLDATDDFEEAMKRMDIVRQKYQVLVDEQQKLQTSQKEPILFLECLHLRRRKEKSQSSSLIGLLV